MYTRVRRLGGLSAKPKDQLDVDLLILKELAKIRETLKDVVSTLAAHSNPFYLGVLLTNFQVALLVLQRVGGE